MKAAATLVRNPLAIAALGEAATGLALVAAPVLVVDVLFGVEIGGAGIVVGRIAGIALIALGIACWPGGTNRPMAGMLAYSLLAALYLAWLGAVGGMAGKLLWPAVGLHIAFTILLARAWSAACARLN